jgi:retron-type reverse transcriptase
LVHGTKAETLTAAYPQAKRNGGVPGLDGQTFAEIETGGRAQFLAARRDERLAGTSHPQPKRGVEIPKGEGQGRTRQIPCLRERIGHGALKLSLEAIFAADFCPNSYGYRPPRAPHHALAEVRRRLRRRRRTVSEGELARYFDTIRHDLLLPQIARRVQDPAVLPLVQQIVQGGGKIGVPQGGPFSPLAANSYLNEGDGAFDAMRRQTAQGP